MKTTRILLAIYFASVWLMWQSCGEKNAHSNGSENLELLRRNLQEKQDQLRILSAEIEELNQRINELDTAEKPKRLVVVDTVQYSNYEHYIDFQATVQSDEVLNVSSEMGGRVTKLLVKEGQIVQRGQLIARLDSETLQKQLEELETTLQLATTVLERQQKLWDQKIGSEIQYLEAKNNKERLEKNKETLQSQLAKTKIYAPGSGVVESIRVKEGEFLGPGVPLAVIVNIKKVKIVANIPEVYVGKIKVGDPIKAYFPTLDKTLTTKISLIGKTISAGNRTFAVEAPLKQTPDDLFKPNLLAKIQHKDYISPKAIVISAELLQQDVDGRQFVFTAQPDGQHYKAQKTFVEVDRIFEDKILIKSGLEPGLLIITEGARGLAANELITF